MNRQQQTERFLVSAHRLALRRLREQPHGVQEAAAMLARCAQAGPTRVDTYGNAWEVLLEQGVDAIDQIVCGGRPCHRAAKRVATVGAHHPGQTLPVAAPGTGARMKRSEVEHVLRAAAAIAQEQSFVVVGSQAVLFPFPHAPLELVGSRELDLYPAMNPEKSGLIPAKLQARIAQLNAATQPVTHIAAWANRRAAEAAALPPPATQSDTP